jgi:hypothetical protein
MVDRVQDWRVKLMQAHPRLFGIPFGRPDARAWLLARVTDRPVLYIAGNHEFYGCDIDRTVEKLGGAERTAVACQWQGGSVRRLRRIVDAILRERDVRAMRN